MSLKLHLLGVSGMQVVINIEQILPVDTLKVQISVLDDGCRVVTF